MVKYSCEVCGKNYGRVEEAQECENQELIGFSFEPGLMFSDRNCVDGFIIFYHEFDSEGHERVYHAESFFDFSSELRNVATVGNYKIKASELEKSLSHFKLATNKEVKRLNDSLGEKSFIGLNGLKDGMKKYGIEKLHNNFDEKLLNKHDNQQ